MDFDFPVKGKIRQCLGEAEESYHSIIVQRNQKQEFLLHKRIARVRAVRKYSMTSLLFYVMTFIISES